MQKDLARVISIIGPPAVGKSLLCRLLAAKNNSFLIHEFDHLPEDISDNIVNSRKFIITELWFRNQCVKNILKAFEIKRSGATVLMDTYWGIMKVYAQVVVDDFREKEILNDLFELDKLFLEEPDIIIGLTCSEKQLRKHFKMRNADHEKGSDAFPRILKLKEAYEKFYSENPQILLINTESLDFNEKSDLDIISNRIISSI